MNKSILIVAIAALGLAACGKEEPKVAPKVQVVVPATPAPAVEAAKAAGAAAIDASKDAAVKTVDAAKDAAGKTVDAAKDAAGAAADAAHWPDGLAQLHPRRGRGIRVRPVFHRWTARNGARPHAATVRQIRRAHRRASA